MNPEKRLRVAVTAEEVMAATGMTPDGESLPSPFVTELPGGVLPEGSAPREASVVMAMAREGGGQPLPIEVEVRRGKAPVAGAVLLVDGQVIPGVVTDASGLARIEVRSPARIGARAGSEVAVPAWLDQSEAPKQRVVLALHRQRRVSGLVIDQATQRPLPGASVHFPLLGTRVTTDGHGAFRIDDHPRGRLVVVAEMEGHLKEHFVRNARSDQGDTALRIELLPAAPFVGRVLDPEGRPIPSAAVRAIASSTDTGRQESTELETDAEGRFSLATVPIKGRLSIEVRAHPFSWAHQMFELPVASTELKLDHGPTIHGRCIDEAGRPVAGADVWTACLPADGDIAEERHTSDERGQFELVRVLPGEFLAGGRTADGRLGKWRRFAEADLGASELVLLFANRGAVVRGKVTDRGGRPYANARVDFRPSGQKKGALWVTANAEGAYEIAALTKGEWSVQVDSYEGHPSSPPVSITFDGESDQVLDLRGAPRSISGRVVDEEGVPLSGVSVGFDSPTGVDGTFTAPLGEIGTESLYRPGEVDHFERVRLVVPDGEDDLDVGDVVLRGKDFLVFVAVDPAGAASPGSGSAASLRGGAAE